MAANVADCMLLTYRGQYSTCQIQVPDVDGKLGAVEIGGLYYSCFQKLENADKTLRVLTKLTESGDRVALTTTSRSYLIWVFESEARLVVRQRPARRPAIPTHPPARCLLLPKLSSPMLQPVMLPDSTQPVMALHHHQGFYSLHRQQLTAAAAMELGAKLVWRGNTIAIAPMREAYAVFIEEPEAAPAPATPAMAPEQEPQT